MSELSHIQMFVFLILMLQFTVTEQLSSSVAVRAGDDVTLTCERVKDEQIKCKNVEWIYNDADHTRTDALFRNGHLETLRSNRLRLGEKCSLVIKKVKDQDVGHYVCRQDGDSDVYLSVVTLTEEEFEYKIHFYCYVSSHKHCKPSVKWLNQDKVFLGQRDVKASQTRYYAVVSFEASQHVNSSVMNSLTCEVIDCSSNIHQFSFRPRASDKDVKPATTESSTSTSVRISSTTGWWRIIIVSVGLTTLIITVVTVDIWIRTKGNKTQMNQTTVDEDEDDDTVKYEHVGVSSASV